jgi:hypothetical protein
MHTHIDAVPREAGPFRGTITRRLGSGLERAGKPQASGTRERPLAIRTADLPNTLYAEGPCA